ncbi:hypothetical protein O3M35_000366 [Rhynocoris fuscipes]|uniref:Uncharacterized protein n=1 Tax=Rhynocoris fuscipes TaxID=488301 RepID=A0AAW1DPX0_9HEMI
MQKKFFRLSVCLPVSQSVCVCVCVCVCDKHQLISQKTIADILMQLFAFGTTSGRADYIKISNESDQQCCQQDRSNLKMFYPPYLKNGYSQLKNFLYSLLMLLDLALISFWAPSAKQGCHFTYA